MLIKEKTYEERCHWCNCYPHCNERLCGNCKECAECDCWQCSYKKNATNYNADLLS